MTSLVLVLDEIFIEFDASNDLARFGNLCATEAVREVVGRVARLLSLLHQLYLLFLLVLAVSIGRERHLRLV